MFKEIQSQFVEKTSRPLRGALYMASAAGLFLGGREAFPLVTEMLMNTPLETGAALFTLIPTQIPALRLLVMGVDNLAPSEVKDTLVNTSHRLVNRISEMAQGRARPDVSTTPQLPPRDI